MPERDPTIVSRAKRLAVQTERRLARRLARHLADPERLSGDRARSAGVLAMGEGSYGRMEVLHFHGEPSRVRIGRYSSVADGVLFIPGGNHNIGWVSTAPLPGCLERGHPFSKGDIVVGSDVWIGARAIILSGVTIGDGAVIGAGSVVTRDVPPYAVVTGNPAAVAKLRFAPHQIEALLRIRWWEWPEPEVHQAAPLLLSTDIDEFIELHG